MMIGFADPRTGDALEAREGALWNRRSGERVAPIVAGIPRFVAPGQDYADSFAWQWKHWRDTTSDRRRTGGAKRELLMQRTHFLEYKLDGRTILECGMGGGNDTEVLLALPFAEVHAFDLSRAVERARDTLHDPRLVLSQASIFEIPYPDEAFDFVFCHRVLQHTPDPVRALRCVAAKVKPGGVLFVHCYRRSWRTMMAAKYKVRWLSKRLPHRWIHWYVETFGERLHRLNARLRGGNRLLYVLAENFVPFEWRPAYGPRDEAWTLEFEKLCTFDALTPRYDKPLTARTFRRTLEAAGFRIEHLQDDPGAPLLATAVRI